MAIEVGQRVAGKLVVVRRLGAGGVGEVWEVEHTLTRHRRAMKVLHQRFASNPDVVERFLREASAAGRIGDPHIVETFDAGQLEDGTHYLLMELLSGEALSTRLRSTPAPSQADAVGWVRQACLALAAAHAAGIVHRDLKPDNLFLTRDTAGRPFLKVLDFGVSLFDELSHSGERLTREGSTMGTPLYMSPEQLAGERVDVRTDLYALGVILYECLCLQRPFDAPTLAALAVRISIGDAPSLHTLRPSLPAGLIAVVQRAMHKARSERYGSALELYEALSPFEEDAELATLEQTLPSTEKSPGRPAATPPHPKRAKHWLGVSVGVAAAGLIAGALVWSARPAASTPPLEQRPDAGLATQDAGPPPVLAEPPPQLVVPPVEPPPRDAGTRRTKPSTLIQERPYED